MTKLRPDSIRDRRRATHRHGLFAETWALVALMAKGYRPLARRYAAAGGEIDLIVRRGRIIAFVEVKARPSFEMAAIAIDARKRVRMSRAARAWISRHPTEADMTLRADAVFVMPRTWPRHLPNVFELEGL